MAMTQRDEPPELAYSWPFALMVVLLPVFALALARVIPQEWGYVIFVPFPLCLVRDWMLDRYWPNR